MRKFQKGQALVEFAFVLPFLILFMIGLMYFGMMFSNYVAMNNFAREVARTAAMMEDTKYDSIRKSYVKIYDDSHPSVSRNRYFLPNSLYLWDPNDPNDLDIQYVSSDSSNGEVVVTLTAEIDTEEGLSSTFSNVIGAARLDKLVVTYRMYSEVNHSSSSNT